MGYSFNVFHLDFLKLNISSFFASILLGINTLNGKVINKGYFYVIGVLKILVNFNLKVNDKILLHISSNLLKLDLKNTQYSIFELNTNKIATQSGNGKLIYTSTVAQTLDGGDSSAKGRAQLSLISISFNKIKNISKQLLFEKKSLESQKLLSKFSFTNFSIIVPKLSIQLYDFLMGMFSPFNITNNNII